LMRSWSRGEEQQVGPIDRSTAWIATAAVASLLFIFVLGLVAITSTTSRSLGRAGLHLETVGPQHVAHSSCLEERQELSRRFLIL
jgi:hypothetical protein